MGVLVRNSGTADLTVDPAGTETVNGGATVTLAPGFFAELFNAGTGWTALVSPTGSVLGLQLLWAATPAAGRAALGAATTGDALFTAATPGAGRTALGAGATGDAVCTAPTPGAGRVALGSGTTGEGVFQATTPAAARGTIGAAPQPTDAGGAVGQLFAGETANGAALLLPTGGTWAWWGAAFHASNRIWAPSPAFGAGVHAGGTTVMAARSDVTHVFCVWRIA